MNWYRRNRLYTVVFVLVLLFGALIETQNPVRDSLRAGTRSVAAVAWAVVHGMGNTIDRYGGLSSRAKLATENQKLREEIARSESLALHHDVLRSQTATLRGMFSLREAYSEGIAAPVLSNPSASPYSTFVIGSGTEEGVKAGAYVVSAPRVAIGRIVEADAHTALVGLFSAPDKETEVMIGKVRTMYRGKGDGNGIVVVPRGAAVALGDAAVLPGRPFAIGFVGIIQSKPEDAETTVLVRVPANLPSLSFVYIVPE